MEKSFALSGYKTVCLIALVLIACCTINSLFVLLYTNTQLMQINERISKLEGKYEVLDNAEVENHGMKIQSRSVLLHRDKRSAPVTLDRVSKRLKTLENRINTALNNKINKDYWLLPLLKGRDGRDGRPGPPGPKGEKGGPGPKGDQGLQSSTGVQYVRWGRTTCPSDAQLLYTGRIGGPHYTHYGGGSNYLCLSNNPKYAAYKDGWQTTGAIYGTEYETSSFDRFRNLQDHEAPCAVCYVSSRSSQLMHPARNDCPSGWTLEYWGYLMSGHYSHKHSTTFICVDQDAEYVPGTSANANGALLYNVQGSCSSLPCLPYVEGRELTCAVCSK